MTRHAALLALLALAPGLPTSAAITRHASVAGLAAPARIVVDTWGVPHIFAASERDAFFLQGWNAARDRLWQIDLWRKRGLGLLSASFGPAYVAQDRAARLFLYRGDMEAEWAAYAPAARAEVEAFTAGVNAYVGAVRHGERPLDDVLPDGGGTPREFAAEEPGPDLRLVQREDGEIVRDALRKLPENQRSALVLRYCEGLKLREIAEILEIPETTAAARVATGLAAVTRILEPQFAERKPAERRSLTIV